jgi:hypothetical protein
LVHDFFQLLSGNWVLFLWYTAGGFALKKQMLDDRRFPNMHLNLQRILQVVCPPCLISCKHKNNLSWLVQSHISRYLSNASTKSVWIRCKDHSTRTAEGVKIEVLDCYGWILSGVHIMEFKALYFGHWP